MHIKILKEKLQNSIDECKAALLNLQRLHGCEENRVIKKLIEREQETYQKVLDYLENKES